MYPPPQPSVQALFTRHELLSRGRLAVIGLTPEQEQIFMASYARIFPLPIITFVERYRLKDIIGEQDLLKGRLDDNTRAKIRRILGVEALILCTYYDDDAVGAGGKKLRIRIVDSETGVILGSVMTIAGDNFFNHCEMAVKALKKDLISKEKSEKISSSENL
ncbi:hypothetical protein ACFL5Z_16500 [Planctomycetota bacterium]